MSNQTVLAALAISQDSRDDEPQGNRHGASFGASLGTGSAIADKIRSVRNR